MLKKQGFGNRRTKVKVPCLIKEMPRAPRASTAKCYMITHQGPWDAWHPLTELPDGVVFLAYQEEVAPTTGQHHMQMFVQYEKAGRYMDKIQQLLGPCHVETMSKHSSPQKCFDYVTKAETRVNGPWQLGELSKQGQRSDLLEFRDAIKSGRSNTFLATEYFPAYLKYHKSVPHLREVLAPPPPPRFGPGDFTQDLLPLPKATVFHGPTGIGKTQFALAHFRAPLLVRHLDDLGNLTLEHDGIVFDDLDFQHLHFSAILNLVDMDERCSVHIRYQVATIPRGLRRIFTTNDDQIFMIANATVEQRAAIARRVDYRPFVNDLRNFIIE